MSPPAKTPGIEEDGVREVILAMGDGKAAARSIDAYLRG